jgi:predicted MPP superfamily phosphohydrolase
MKVSAFGLFAIPIFFLSVSCSTIPHAGVSRIRSVDVQTNTENARLDGYRIAFISDVHYGNNFSRERFERLVDSVNAERCDCVILGGDYTRGRDEMESFAGIAGGFRARDGVYAVLGNHDFYDDAATFRALLRDNNITVLDDTAVIMPSGTVIAGIDNFTDSFPDAERLLDLVPDGSFTILVSHNPDFAEEIDISRFGLVLSGHTHGGQITLFGYAPIIPSAYGQKYRTGTVMKDGIPVVVSNGAGYSGQRLRFRVFAPSDFIVITLRANDPTKGPQDAR